MRNHRAGVRLWIDVYSLGPLQSGIINITMACIGDEKRKVFPVTADPAVGPGTYNLEKGSPNKPAYAPFSSLQPKFGPTRKPTKQDGVNLGPGSYEVSKGIGQPSFTKIQNDHSIIIKINDFGSSAFRSEQQRFSSLHSSTPGPGQYLQSDSSPSKSRNKRMSKSNQHPIIVNVRKMNEDYDKAREMKSLVQPRSISHNIGPGYYETAGSEFRNNPQEIRGPRWELYKSERFKTDVKEQQTDQHDQILVDQIRRERSKEENMGAPSNFFKSDTVKSYFDEIYYHTQSSLKAEIRRKLGFKNPYPAPGSYLPVYEQPPAHSKYQFFGSTQERFKDKDKLEVGPGDYSIPAGFARQQRRKHRVDKSKRHPIENLNQTPGPGAYNSTTAYFRKPTTNIQQFGSLDARFKTSGNHFTQTQYVDVLTNFQQKLKSPQKIPPQNSSIFRSKTQRDCFITEKQKKILPFGEYNVSQQDIGQRLNKQKNYITHLEYCLLKRPAFDSSTKRFWEENPKIIVQEEGGQQVKSKSLDKTQKIQRPNLGRHEKRSHSSVFKSKDMRRVFEVRYTAPPVGSYDQLMSVKKSFNKRYQPKPANPPPPKQTNLSN